MDAACDRRLLGRHHASVYGGARRLSVAVDDRVDARRTITGRRRPTGAHYSSFGERLERHAGSACPVLHHRRRRVAPEATAEGACRGESQGSEGRGESGRSSSRPVGQGPPSRCSKHCTSIARAMPLTITIIFYLTTFGRKKPCAQGVADSRRLPPVDSGAAMGRTARMGASAAGVPRDFRGAESCQREGLPRLGPSLHERGPRGLVWATGSTWQGANPCRTPCFEHGHPDWKGET